MALTRLDAASALLVIDLQKGILATPAGHPISAVLQNARSLADAFRPHQLPVVLVNVARVPPGRIEQPRNRSGLAADWAELVPELDRQPDDILITKRSWGAFTNTDLERQLRQRGVTQIVIAGVATSAGVEIHGQARS